MDQYPNLARVIRALDEYANPEKLWHFLRQERRRFKFLPGVRTLTLRQIDHLKEVYQMVAKEVKDRARDDGSPEITHLYGTLVIAVIIGERRDPDELIANLCHDLAEDFRNTWSEQTIAQYTKSPTAARIVAVVTRDRLLHMYMDKKEQNHVYFQLLGELEETAKTKLHDVLHNNVTLEGYKKKDPNDFVRLEAQKAKLREVEEEAIPIARRYKYLVKELEEAVAWNWERIRQEETKLKEAPVMAEDREP